MEQKPLSENTHLKIKAALDKLDQEHLDIEGFNLVPSQCYHLGVNPLHLLFNTNCPDKLKEKLQGIIAEHTKENTDTANP